MFYAGAILGLNTLGMEVWYRKPSGEIVAFWYTLISRVQDKSACFTLIQLEDMLSFCRSEGHLAHGQHRFHMISDTGTHFRSYAVLGSLACHFLQNLRPQISEIAVTYGPESHSKNRCDGFSPSCGKR